MLTMFRVTIRTLSTSKRKAIVYELYVLADTAQWAKGLALAEWGAVNRVESVLSMTAEPAGIVARGDLYTSSLRESRPETLPTAKVIAEAEVFLKTYAEEEERRSELTSGSEIE